MAQSFSPDWSGPNGSWDGIENYNRDDFIKWCRKLGISFLGENPTSSSGWRVSGFKEIRYFGDREGFVMPSEHLKEYLDFLSEVFEPVYFVHLTRPLEQVIKSGWFRFEDPDLLKQKIVVFNKNIAQLLEGNKNYFHIDYTDILDANSVNLKRLFEFLDLGFCPEKVTKCLSIKHGAKRIVNPS